ncbi:hypothetical protein P5673_008641 [Acropora cervicornis]|uniref:Uncharacterized protein n=1 Tax=Acropora cervicornis TaxID=6130 RepID=A0AAD9VA59_ACRCE|nr:hypothetical protein P5673_008641 [Acropora cervicornis]
MWFFNVGSLQAQRISTIKKVSGEKGNPSSLSELSNGVHFDFTLNYFYQCHAYPPCSATDLHGLSLDEL